MPKRGKRNDKEPFINPMSALRHLCNDPYISTLGQTTTLKSITSKAIVLIYSNVSEYFVLPDVKRQYLGSSMRFEQTNTLEECSRALHSLLWLFE